MNAPIRRDPLRDRGICPVCHGANTSGHHKAVARPCPRRPGHRHCFRVFECFACGTVNSACGVFLILLCGVCRTVLTPGARRPYWLPAEPVYRPWRHPGGDARSEERLAGIMRDVWPEDS